MVNMDDVQSMAHKYIRSEEMTMVLVGDANLLLNKVRPFGPVSVYDLDDNPVN